MPEELEVDHSSQYGHLHDDDDPQQQLVGHHSVRRPESHMNVQGHVGAQRLVVCVFVLLNRNLSLNYFITFLNYCNSQ